MVQQHSTEVQQPPFGVLTRQQEPRYPVREVWLLTDAIEEAELVADAWQETAFVYEASCYDGERSWLVYNVTTETGIAEMGIDPGRVVASRKPEAVSVGLVAGQ